MEYTDKLGYTVDGAKVKVLSSEDRRRNGPSTLKKLRTDKYPSTTGPKRVPCNGLLLLRMFFSIQTYGSTFFYKR